MPVAHIFNSWRISRHCRRIICPLLFLPMLLLPFFFFLSSSSLLLLWWWWCGGRGRRRRRRRHCCWWCCCCRRCIVVAVAIVAVVGGAVVVVGGAAVVIEVAVLVVVVVVVVVIIVVVLAAAVVVPSILRSPRPPKASPKRMAFGRATKSTQTEWKWFCLVQKPQLLAAFEAFRSKKACLLKQHTTLFAAGLLPALLKNLRFKAQTRHLQNCKAPCNWNFKCVQDAAPNVTSWTL